MRGLADSDGMKFEFSTFCFRLTLEFFWLGPPPLFRRYRIIPDEAAVRRQLLRRVRHRLRE